MRQVSESDQPRRRQTIRREEDRQLRKQINRHIQLFGVGQVITSEMNFDTLFEVIADQTNRIMDSERCSVFLADEKDTHLTAFLSTDLKKNDIRIPCDQGVAGWVFCHRLPLIVADAYRDRRFYPDIDQKTGFKTQNILCVPLINRKKECIGTLQALNKNSGNFNEDDREVLSYLSNYVTIAIENAKLYEELKAADRAKERVISHLSHELRTPLAIIASAFKIIEQNTRNSDDTVIKKTAKRGRRSVARLMQIQEKADDIIKLRPFEESKRILGIIEDAVGILDELEESSSGEYEKVLCAIKRRLESIFAFDAPRMERLALDGVLQETLRIGLPSNQRDYPEITRAIEDGLFISMDRDVLRKVLAGLLKNAVENTPDEGLIEITARSIGDEIQVAFKDYGVGITEENQKNIFSGFYHTRDTNFYTSKKPYDFAAGGAGLDLLRTKIFSANYGFALSFDSRRCRWIPRDSDRCEGRVSECPHIKDRSECLASGGSTFTLTFPKPK
jgi:signal transduction histidine kinase